MKQIGFLTLLITAMVVLMLAFPVAASGPAPAASAAAIAPPAPPAAPAVAPVPPPHPHIAAALEAMHSARHELETAAHDFHGHRVKSIEHLDQAIHEAEICMQEP
ncbi:MAG TPA: hypothetical protein VMG31_00480 [Verrucomicrobiae bacterium]|nr:hypothetical protein [Verrucomicrobiae bacterium]